MGGEVDTRARRTRGARGSRTNATLALLAAGAALAGCNTRVRQCNALIDTVNAEQDAVVRVLNRVGTPPEPEPIEALARSFDSAVARVSAVPIEDQGLRDRAVTLQGVMRRFASEISAMSTAARGGDAADYNAHRRNLEGLNNALGAAVDSVNAYCGR